MAAGIQNIRIEQGATFRLSLQWQSNALPVNISGYVARMQIRSDIASPNFIHELTNENGGIIFQSTETGEFQLYISSIDTSKFNFTSGVYDLEMQASNGDVFRLLQGKVTLSLEVTRD